MLSDCGPAAPPCPGVSVGANIADVVGVGSARAGVAVAPNRLITGNVDQPEDEWEQMYYVEEDEGAYGELELEEGSRRSVGGVITGLQKAAP